MITAAREFQFEKATALRDRLRALEWIDSRLLLLRQARNRNSFVYPLNGHDGRTRWYLIHRGEVRAVCFAPSTDSEHDRAESLLISTFTRGVAELKLADGGVDSVLLIAAWFRKNGLERERLMSGTQVARAVRAKLRNSTACKTKEDVATGRC